MLRKLLACDPPPQGFGIGLRAWGCRPHARNPIFCSKGGTKRRASHVENQHGPQFGDAVKRDNREGGDGQGDMDAAPDTHDLSGTLLAL